MTEKCDYLQTDRFVTGFYPDTDEDGFGCLSCLRPLGHEGPHLIQRSSNQGGVFVLWENIVCEDCDCPCLHSFDWEDCCVAYGEVSPEEAQKFIEDGAYEG